MKKMKSMLSLLLTIVMVFSMTLTAFADDPTTYTITISNPKEVPKGGHTYEAYQIFKGDLYEDPDTGDKVLSNIEWGKHVNASTIVDAIKNTPYDDGIANSTLGENPLIAEVNTAEDMANVLQSYGNSDSYLKIFSIAFGNNLVNSNPYISKYNSESKEYQITVNEPGYYLIKDKDSSIANDDSSTRDTYTSYILEVVSDVDVTAKSDTLSIDKLVDGDDYADFGVGDVVPYTIQVRLPNNVSDYNQYKLDINDILSDALTLDEDSIEVLYEGELISEYSYVLTFGNGTETSPSLKIAFDNLNNITNADGETIEIGTDASIYVEYNATLNKQAEHGMPGNINTAYAVFSNNPNSSDSTSTVKDIAPVYTYELTFDKVDENGDSLGGADFEIEKCINPKDNKADWEWESLGKTTDIENSTISVSKSYNIFYFTGLDDGTYRLTEIITPDGYNTMDPIIFTVVSNPDINEITSLTATVIDGEASLTTSTDTGLISTTIKNYKGTTLPSTGGMGTTVIYIVGAVLALGAVVVLITRRRVNSVK